MPARMPPRPPTTWAMPNTRPRRVAGTARAMRSNQGTLTMASKMKKTPVPMRMAAKATSGRVSPRRRMIRASTSMMGRVSQATRTIKGCLRRQAGHDASDE